MTQRSPRTRRRCAARWQEDQDEPFVLSVAPDHFHKDNVSGGAPYGIVLPDACADAHFVGEVGMPLVSYLNWVFRHGGFPRPTVTTGSGG
ncbi:hypothetical protein DLE60_10210 [Micromonospora globispora]|uniref:Uncharacterized protein n=1 Tax=Micromonospora globispora TaxID=1450148 RepID=A0A317JWP0_9ACTN|nr:hypothetical protein DLJ46_26195 [Micromonospora globispora]PWU60598.1 hypothetical protein DLE60_10210 [Micromonospora globispora]RQW99539.1 hypothetical protein DKL51_08345 [Micromonospora globispora]